MGVQSDVKTTHNRGTASSISPAVVPHGGTRCIALPPRLDAYVNHECLSAHVVRGRGGSTFQGISVGDRGVFTAHGETYAGQFRDGYACGLGVLDLDGSKIYAEHGLDGTSGRYLELDANGIAVYIRFEHGGTKDQAFVFLDGECDYNGESCTLDDPRVLALIAQVAPVEALANAAATEAEEAVDNLPRRLARLDLMVTVLLARNRPLPTVAATLAAELLTLPSGLLVMVCDAIVR
jgi:hypothetical protein